MRLERWGERLTRLYTALVFAFLFLPILIVVVYSFNAGRHVTDLIGFSTKWYSEAWSDRFLMDALGNSLTIATTTAVLATILGTASALAMDRLGPRKRWLFELLTYVAIIVPGIVIGIATLIFIVTALDWVNPWIAYFTAGGGPELGLGTASVVAAHTLFTMAIVNVLVRTRMRGMDRTLLEASEDLFATPWRTFRQVTLPMLLPAIVAGALLAFTFSFDDFIIAFFTSGQDQTVPIYLFASIRRGVSPEVNAIATVLLTVTILAMLTRGGRLPARPAAGGGDRGSRGRRGRGRGGDGAHAATRRRALVMARAVARPLLADVVRDGLRRAVITGGYEQGSKLPNEDALADQFAVSRATIREAVRGLVEEGYLMRRQGSGTFVTARPMLRNSLDTNFSYTAYLESTGVRAGRRILGIRTVPADEDVAEHLLVDAGSLVVELTRVRTADDRPAVYSVDRMPADVVDGVRDRQALGGSIYALLAARGHPVRHGEAAVKPAAADRHLAAVLAVPEGTLLQHLEQVDIDSAGRRVLYSLEWHVPSVIELRVYRRGPGTAD